MIVGFAAGGGNDIFARLVATKLPERTGWTVIIENKPGAGGRLAADYAAKEAPDGYTVLVGASGAMAIGPIIYKTGYDTLKSFEPVTMIADFPLILVVHPDHPAKTVKELVEWTKANPDKANYSTSSPAFTLPTELFKLRTGAQGRRPSPTRAAARCCSAWFPATPRWRSSIRRRPRRRCRPASCARSP